MNPGDVVLVKFPFANLETTKKRPALLLFETPVSRKASLRTIAMITSKLDGLEIDGDVKLTEWQAAKLLHPSLVRLSKIATVDSELVEKRIGTLAEADQKSVKRALHRLLARWL